MKMADILLIW